MATNFQFNNKGYTLIEVLVAMSIFLTIIAAPTSFFVSSLKGQQKALASQEMIDNVSYIMEYMSRALRMAKKDLTGTCIGQNMNYENLIDAPGIRFLNYQDKCQKFFLEDETLKESKDDVINNLTPNDLEVVSFKIGLSGDENPGDNKQPRVTLFLEVRGKRGQKTELQPEIKIQTTISQRNLDI